MNFKPINSGEFQPKWKIRVKLREKILKFQENKEHKKSYSFQLSFYTEELFGIVYQICVFGSSSFFSSEQNLRCLKTRLSKESDQLAVLYVLWKLKFYVIDDVT